MSSVPLQRSPQMMGQPVRLYGAFPDAEVIERLIARGAPYKTITAIHRNPPNDNTPGWFRNFWALGGNVIFDGAEEVFHNPIFIEAAKKSFDAEVIQPLAMMTNLNTPAPASPVHLDLPFFRGAHEREVPNWILAPMGYSGLFQRWAIPVASAISWFYPGTGGDFDYWPEGLDGPCQTVKSPCINKAVVADNEYMYHRVGQMGIEPDYLHDGISSDALLHLDDDTWEIRRGETMIRAFRRDQVRVSVLWKAYCFKDEQAADAFRDPAFNLTPDTIVDIFCQDLRERGVAFEAPTSLTDDHAWMEVVLREYNSPDGSAY